MDRSHALVAFLLGVCAALGVALVLQSGNALPQAHAQASGSGEMFAVTGTGTSGQSRDVLFLIDSRATRVAVYEYKDGNLSLGAVRNIEYDLRFEEWAPNGKKQQPAVKDQRDQTEKDAGGAGKKKR